MLRDIKETLEEIKFSQEDFKYNEDNIITEYKQLEDEDGSLIIKIVSFLGGIFSALSLIALLFITEIIHSETSLIVLGIIFILTSVIVTKYVDKLIVETSTLTLYITGVIILSGGLLDKNVVNENLVILILFIISFLTLIIIERYLLSLTAVLIFNGSFFFWIIENKFYSLIILYLSINILLFTIFSLFEAKIITFNKKVAKLYDPFKVSFLVIILFVMSIVSEKLIFNFKIDNFYLSSILPSLIILYVISDILKLLNIDKLKYQVVAYLFSILFLALLFYSPTIIISILILILSFLVNFKTGFSVGILSFLYFLSRFYYDLSYTLLIKSIMLFSSGILFILFYIIISRKFKNR